MKKAIKYPLVLWSILGGLFSAASLEIWLLRKFTDSQLLVVTIAIVTCLLVWFTVELYRDGKAIDQAEKHADTEKA